MINYHDHTHGIWDTEKVLLLVLQYKYYTTVLGTSGDELIL